MPRHGSETYFVVGEGAARRAARRQDARGSGGGRRFVFRGWGRRENRETARRAEPQKHREAMTVDNLSPGTMPAGFTYLGQFLDHDLTFDKTAVMEGVDVSPATSLQSRSPSLDLDSLYGNGPAGSGVGEVLRERRLCI